MSLSDALVNELRRKISYVQYGKVHMTDNEMMNLIATLQHEPLEKNEAIEYLTMTEEVFNRYVSKGLLPKGRKRLDSIGLVWYMDELNDALMQIIEKRSNNESSD